MAGPTGKRTTRYVSSLIQGRLMWRMTVYWLVYNAALIFVLAGERLIWLVPDLLTGGRPVTASEFLSNFYQVGRPLLIAMAVFCPLMLWDMMRYSHRIAGPLYHFRRAMDAFAAGEKLQRVRLREDDLLEEFQNTFNRLVDRVNKEQAQGAEELTSGTPESEPLVATPS